MTDKVQTRSQIDFSKYYVAKYKQGVGKELHLQKLGTSPSHR